MCVRGRGAGIRDQGSGIRDQGSGIRKCGSALSKKAVIVVEGKHLNHNTGLDVSNPDP
jgi:hypothetical protein